MPHRMGKYVLAATLLACEAFFSDPRAMMMRSCDFGLHDRARDQFQARAQKPSARASGRVRQRKARAQLSAAARGG